jgi:predicted nucleic acid-binding protein
VPALFDTTVAVLLLRRRPPAAAEGIIGAARSQILAGSALLASPGLTELLIGESTPRGTEALRSALERLPTASLPPEAADDAGVMGAFLRSRGASIPFADLQIAATAVWLEIPLLAWDGDYARSKDVALASKSTHPGADLWRALQLHPASRGA